MTNLVIKPFKLNVFGNILSLRVFCFSLTLLGVYYVREKYFSLGNYFLLPILTIIISLLSYITKGRWVKTNTLPLLVLIYVIFSVVLIGNYTFDIVASYFLMFTLFYLLTIGSYTEFEIKYLLFCYILSAVILSLILLCQHRIPYLDMFRFSVFYTETDFYDVNFLASYLLLPALFSFYFAWIVPERKISLLFMLSNIIILVSMLATGSRACIIGFIIGIFPIFKSMVKNIRLLFVVVVFIFLVVYYLPDELMGRLFINSYNDTSQNRRFDDWLYALKCIEQYPFFGSGFSTSSSVIYKLFRVNITAHNSFLAMMMNFGIIGSLPILILIFKPLFILYKKRDKFFFFFYIAFIFNVSIIEAITSFVFIVPLIVFHLLISKNNVIKYT